MSGDAGETMTERGATSNVRLWVVLRLNRWVLTGAILLVAFVVLVGSSRIGLTPLRAITRNQGGLWFLFTSFIGAIITGTSIVVTINQLVLAQELGAVGDQRERMRAAMDFRQDVESQLGVGTSPPEPAGFLHELVDGIQRRGHDLEATVAGERDEELKVKAEITAYVEELTENARAVKDDLEDAQFGTFDVLWAGLNFNYSRKIYDARRIRETHSSALSAETEEAIDEVVEVLTFFGPAREHFKTLYFQWELINLSRTILYIAIQALVVMGILTMYVDANSLTGSTLGVSDLVWVTSAGFVVGIAPFVVFTVYIVRIVTVAKRTLAMGPFILRRVDEDGEDDGD